MLLNGREMRSRIDADGTMLISLEEVCVPDPNDDELVVAVEAAPINPSDISQMLGPVDVATLTRRGDGPPAIVGVVPSRRLAAARGRIGASLPIGNEGAGMVVAAGCHATELIGRRVGMFGGAMYADYRLIDRKEVVALPDTVSAAEGAASFVNPMTALGFVETARREGHRAIVHTAAASNLGQMLQRLCLADRIPLVNIVRSAEQADVLTELGGRHVVNSGDDDFRAKLADAVAETGATIAFDAIGGGSLGSDILQAMERGAAGSGGSAGNYGSDVFKHLFIYGALDVAPTMLRRVAFGFQWSVSGWLLLPFLKQVGAETAARLRRRSVDELTTTFASRYTRTIGLAEALSPEVLRSYERKATGEKYLIDPTLD